MKANRDKSIKERAFHHLAVIQSGGYNGAMLPCVSPKGCFLGKDIVVIIKSW